MPPKFPLHSLQTESTVTTVIREAKAQYVNLADQAHLPLLCMTHVKFHAIISGVLQVALPHGLWCHRVPHLQGGSQHHRCDMH